MKFLFFAAVFSLAACSGDENENNGTSNNGLSNNGTTNGSNGSNNGTSNNGTVSNNGTSNNGTTSETSSPTTSRLKFSATGTDFTSTQFFDVVADFGGTPDTVVDVNTLPSGDVGIALGENYYFVLDRGEFGVHKGSIEVYNLDGVLDGKVDLTGNIKDAVDVGDKIFITSYQDGMVQVIKKEGANWALSTPIDLNSFDAGGGDSDPEVDAIIANGNDVLVVLQTLTEFDAIEKSRVVVIDATTDLVVDQVAGGEVDALELLNRNAFAGLVKVSENTFAVGSIGDFGAASADAGIEILTKGNDGLYTTSSYMTEEDFGLDLFSFLFTGDDKGFALIGFESSLVAFESGAPLDELPGDIVSDGTTSMSVMGDYLVVAYVNVDDSGFRVYELSTGNLLREIPVTLTEGSTISNVVITSTQ